MWTCSSCGGENPDGMRFCGHCGSPQVAEAEAPDASQTLRSFVAEPVADRLVESGGEIPQERRLITALFADVSGFTALADRLDPEDLLEVIDPVISGLSSIVGHYGGYVEKFAGDALLALFGAPVSHEDDAERALLVALEMHRELARMCRDLPHDAELTLHCGVNSGHGIARILGSDARMDYAVLGDSVILAQRLESAAPKGETYVSDLTYRLTADRFDFEPVGELTLKGKSEAVVAWRLVGERSAPRVTGSDRALVGRAAELQSIGMVLDAMRAEQGGVVVLTGEPGVGKTKLSEAARERAKKNGSQWLQTRCLSYGAGLAYWPYAELLRTVAEIPPHAEPDAARDALLRSVPAETAPYFIRLLALPGIADDEVGALEPDAFRRGLHEAFATWFSALATERPLVVALEDVHWADASSLELTRELTRICQELPLGLYLTARPEAETTLAELAPDAQTVRLGPLDEAGIGDLVGQALEGQAPADLVSWVFERTTGNPFFVEELVRALRERDILVQSDGHWQLRPRWEEGELPPTVEGLLAARIDLLPKPAADVLQSASVIGRVVGIPLLAAVHGHATELEGRVDTLEQRGFFDRSDAATVTFHHALVQDVAYARLLRKQQRDLHLRVAEAAETLFGAGDDVVALLARHLYLGEAGTKAVDYLVRAGERARQLFANEEAIVHFSRAAEVAERESLSEQRVEILLSLADLQDLVGNYDEAIRLYTDVRAASADIRSFRGLTAAHRKRGEYEQALAVVEEAFRTEALGGMDHTALWLEQGTTLSTAGHFDRAIEVLELGLAAAGARGDTVATQLLVPLARAEMLSGRSDAALRHATEAQARFAENDDLRSLSSTARLLGDIYATLDRPEDAAQILRYGLALAQRVGNVEEIGGCLLNLGVAESTRGAVADAVTYYEHAIAEFERIGHGSGRAIGYSNLAWELANNGDYERAEDYCLKAIELSRSIGHLLVTAETTDTMALIRLRRGQADEAGVEAEEAARLFLELGALPKAAQALDFAASAWEVAGDEARARETRSRARALI